MKIDFTPFRGEHCETTTVGNLLAQQGINFSEPMLFGIGEGLGFLFWQMKTMDFPFIGGRIKTDFLTENICKNLNLQLDVKETSSIKKAWKNIEGPLLAGQIVGLKLDCYHLDYFTNKIHFAGHYATIYGYDSKKAYLIDTNQQGGKVETSLENLCLARNERGPMSSRNRSFTIRQITALPPMKEVAKKAILKNANDFLNPPIKNFGYLGIEKTATEINKWFHRSRNVKTEFHTSAMLMERAGTAGALFRNLYRDFLMECIEAFGLSELSEGYKRFVEIAPKWTEISELFIQIGETKNIKYLDQAAELLLQLSKNEKDAMTILKEACS